MASEFDLIQRYFTRPAEKAVLGVGDDCALWEPSPGMLQAVSTDMLIEGRHFLAGTDPEKLGRKALAVNLSDLAAMGAEPRHALLAIALPAADEKWIASFARGFFAQAARHGIELIGGDTTRGPLAISITVIGEVSRDHALRRDAALAGEDVWLSGGTGAAALGLAHLQGRVQLAGEQLSHCLARLDDPDPRVALGLRLRGIARAAIDISDGLLADLGHIAENSGVGIDIHADRLPVEPALRGCADADLLLECIAAGGDDYELAFTAPAANRAAIEQIGSDLGLCLTAIGVVVPGNAGVNFRDPGGQPVKMARAGFDHFGA